MYFLTRLISHPSDVPPPLNTLARSYQIKITLPKSIYKFHHHISSFLTFHRAIWIFCLSGFRHATDVQGHMPCLWDIDLQNWGLYRWPTDWPKDRVDFIFCNPYNKGTKQKYCQGRCEEAFFSYRVMYMRNMLSRDVVQNAVSIARFRSTWWKFEVKR